MKVWAIADSKRQGFLGFNEFVTAMQVIFGTNLFVFSITSVLIDHIEAKFIFFFYCS